MKKMEIMMIIIMIKIIKMIFFNKKFSLIDKNNKVIVLIKFNEKPKKLILKLEWWKIIL